MSVKEDTYLIRDFPMVVYSGFSVYMNNLAKNVLIMNLRNSNLLLTLRIMGIEEVLTYLLTVQSIHMKTGKRHHIFFLFMSRDHFFHVFSELIVFLKASLYS